MGGGKGGGGGGGGDYTQALQQQAQIANQMIGLSNRQMGIGENLLAQSDPLRGALMQNLAYMAGAGNPYMPVTGGYGTGGYGTGGYGTGTPAIGSGAVTAKGSGGSWRRAPGRVAYGPLPEGIKGRKGFLFNPVTTGDISSHPAYAASKAAIENQYSQARDIALESLPGDEYSGLYSSTFNDLFANRADALAQMTGQIGVEEAGRRERLLNLAAQMATGGTAGGLSGVQAAAGPMSAAGGMFGQSAGIQAMMANAQAQRGADKKGGMGELVGTLGGAYIGKPG